MIYKYGKRFRFAPSFNKYLVDKCLQIQMPEANKKFKWFKLGKCTKYM